MYILKDIIKIMEELYPSHLAETWDNIGLMVGSSCQEINKVLCALDVTQEVVREAKEVSVDCIITHHPLIFKPLRNLNFDIPKNNLIKELIINNIAVYSAHTNFDIAEEGINDILCNLLSIENTKLLVPTEREKLCKLVVYSPEDSYDKVREAIIHTNSCLIGNYKGCTFTGPGEGTFIPLSGSRPYLGSINTLEKADERRIESVIYQRDLDKIMTEVKKVHPYEEIACNVFELENLERVNGIGRYGRIKKTTVGVFSKRVKEILNVPFVRLIGNPDKEIEWISICSGSGSEYIKQAARVSDLYITGDIKFHEAQEALDLGLTVLDVGHYASENIAIPYLANSIRTKLTGLEVICSQVSGEVFNIV